MHVGPRLQNLQINHREDKVRPSNFFLHRMNVLASRCAAGVFRGEPALRGCPHDWPQVRSSLGRACVHHCQISTVCAHSATPALNKPRGQELCERFPLSVDLWIAVEYGNAVDG